MWCVGCVRACYTDQELVGCMTKLLAQSLDQSKATLKAIQGMKNTTKGDGDANYNWLLTYASLDILTMTRTLISELLPGVCMICVPTRSVCRWSCEKSAAGSPLCP